MPIISHEIGLYKSEWVNVFSTFFLHYGYMYFLVQGRISQWVLFLYIHNEVTLKTVFWFLIYSQLFVLSTVLPVLKCWEDWILICQVACLRISVYCTVNLLNKLSFRMKIQEPSPNTTRVQRKIQLRKMSGIWRAKTKAGFYSLSKSWA